MVYAGAPLTVTFVGFPWNFIITGQYDSNLLAFALVPSFMCLAHILFDLQRTKERMYALPLMLVSAFALATSQTNAIFAQGYSPFPSSFNAYGSLRRKATAAASVVSNPCFARAARAY